MRRDLSLYPSAEEIEQLAIEIRTFLLERDMWQDVDIYFNHKRFGTYDRKDKKYYYNDPTHLVCEEDIEPNEYFEYVAEPHILSMAFEGPVCHMVYYGTDMATKRQFDEIFEKHGLYYEMGNHWNFTCYPIGG